MKKIFLALGLLFLLFPQVASAQSQRNPCFYATSIGARDGCTSVSTANPLPVAASVSASITGFTPNGNFANLTATNVSASVALPTGTTIAVQNTGTTTVSCTLGVGSATAVASQIQVAASSTVFVTPGSNTFLGCIDQTGSTSNVVALAGGAGLGAGFGGGGGGAGGSSAITTWGGATLGAATAWGVAPTGNVNGVNANIVAGSVSVSNFPATQPVSGTVAATESGTWTVQPGNTANTTAWLVNGTGASGAALAGNPFRVALSDGTNAQNWLAAIALADGVNGNNTGAVAGWLWNGTTYDRQRGDLTNGAFVNVKTSVLPTGASTAALQPTNAAQGSTTAGQTGNLIQGAVTTAAPTYTTAQTSPLSLDTTGALRVNVTAGGGAGGTSSSFGSAYPATGTAVGAKDSTGTNMAALNLDASGFLKTNCSAGCTGASDGTQGFSITSSTTSTALALVGTNSVQFNLTGTWAGTVVGQISNDNTNWVSVPLLNTSVAPPAYSAAATGATANGNYLLVGTQGARFARVSVTFTSGTVVGTMTATSQGPSVSFGDYVNYLNLISPTPAGTNVIGHVIADTGSTTAVTALPALVAGTAIVGKVGIDQTTPGTTNLVALAANQSVNLAQVAGASTAVGSGVQATALRTTLATDSPGIVTLGQTTKSASVPMAIASDQVGTAGTANATVTTIQGIASMTPVIANSTNGYPTGAIAETASATGTTAATTATLATAVGKTTYICGFSMRSVATAAAAGNATVTGTITGTLNFTHGTGVTPSVVPNDQRFNPCIPASTTNTSIAVVSPAAGTGGVMSVTAWGFQL